MSAATQRADGLDLFAGGGEMGRLMRAHDWSATPLGPASGWPQSLKTAVRIILGSRYPMFIWWGRELTNLYNDGYLPMLGQRHPAALGKPAAAVWSEIWDTIGPQADAVLYEGRATWNEERLLVLERNGYPEEAYFTFSYSPVPADDGGVGGIFCALTEDTQRVLSQRRLRTLRELSARTTGARTVEQACRAVADTLAQNPHDLPFTLIYLLDGEGRVARLAGTTGLPEGSPACPPALDLDASDGQPARWPFDRVAATGRAEMAANLEARCGRLRCGVWPDPPQSAIVLPVMQSGQDRIAGFLVAGVSPRRAFDDDYRGFLEMLAGHVATAVANARAYEEERRRAEALAELDRAKTAFFSNVSHEFRTPLTLLLGPVEDVLADAAEPPTPRQQERLGVAHRNALRLQKLVNTLLDFSRIEAGRVRASYEPTDLASLTAELASNFRSACEKAGIELRVDCPPLPEPVYVDREMWEKIVLNLLSNAFKYTLRGEIEVALRQVGGRAVLSVRDTGTGIPPDQVPLLFDRFHRVAGAGGRSQEGTGIGLALVKELAHLHGGEVRAESEFGRGSVFTVALPPGRSHLPADRIGAAGTPASTALGAASYVEEALRWLPESVGDTPDPRTDAGPDGARPPGPGQRPRILLADDNSDMRGYVARLLAGHYGVEAVGDGQTALDAARRHPPDLILADVMMPGLDGFGLLRALRADPATATAPVVLLSARAGEEARVEGLQAGADDYLTKPFTARELLARVQAHLALSAMRREANEAQRASEQRFQSFMSHSPATAYIKDAEGRYVFVNRTVERQFDRPLAGWVGKTDFDLFPAEEARLIRRNDQSVLSSRQTARFEEVSTGPDGPHHYLSFKFPLQDRDGWMLAGMSLDVTEQKRAERQLAEAHQFLQSSLDALSSHVAVLDENGVILAVNDAWRRFADDNKFAGHNYGVGANYLRACEPTPGECVEAGMVAGLKDVLAGRLPYFEYEYPCHSPTEQRWFVMRATRFKPPGPVRVVVAHEDVTQRRLAEDALRVSEVRWRTMAEALPNLVWTDLPDGQCDWLSSQWGKYTGIPESELLGLRWLERVIHPDDWERTLACWRAACADRGDYDLEYRIRRYDGEYHWFKTRGVPVRDEKGKIVYWFGTCTDIEDGKRLEAALRQSERRLAEELEAMTRLHSLSTRLLAAKDLTALGDVLENAVVSCAADFGNVQLYNPQARALEIVAQRGFREEFLDYFRTVRVDEGSACAQAMQGGERIVIEDVDLDPSFEPHRPVAAAAGFRAVQSTPLKNSEGTVIGMLSTHFRKPHRPSERDERLLDIHARHAAELVERIRFEQELKEADRRKDEFLATLAHELRNPLAPIRTGLQVMKLARADGQAVEQARTMMERQLEQMVRLIDDLLDLSRISRGKIELRTERVPLARVVQHAVETSRPLIEAAGHALTITLPNEPVFVDADVTRLAQVFSNLLNNAAKYTERGGRIRLAVERQVGDAVVTVSDNGVGIPAPMLSRVFDIFTQVDRSLERSQGGLGIGLSIVKRLVEMHNGGIEAASGGPGMGSTFTVRLPVASSPVAERGGDGGGGVRPRPASRRILIVDDNRDAAVSLGMMLDLMGHETQTAHDGLEAVDVAAAFGPDVILLDIGMPKLNGYDACRRIREQPWGRTVVIVACTGWGQDEDRRRSQEAGFDFHMVKPVDPAAVEKLLAGLKPATA